LIIEFDAFGFALVPEYRNQWHPPIAAYRPTPCDIPAFPC